MSEIVLRSAFLIPFVICMAITATVLWYERTRNPIKKFRTPFGQLLLIGIVLTMLSAGLSAFVAKAILTGDDIAKEMKEAKEKKSYEGGRGGPLSPGGGRAGGSWDRLKHGEDETTTDQPSGPSYSDWGKGSSSEDK